MFKRSIVSIFSLLFAGITLTGTTSAFFAEDFASPQENALDNLRVVPSRYYNVEKPLFRPQKGRGTSRGPTRGTNTYVNRSQGVDVTPDHKNRLKELFERISTENESAYYDNESFSESQLDLRSLISHPCFQPRGAEMRTCMRQLGRFYDLRSSLLSGSIERVLVHSNSDVDSSIIELIQKASQQIRKMPPQATFSQTSSSNSSSQAQWLRKRTLKLWDICQEKFGKEKALSCFQMNSRTLRNRELPLTEKSVY